MQRDRKNREAPTGTRTGPRARAAQQKAFGDPYQRAARPQREGRDVLRPPAAVRLDPDVARVFGSAEAVNEVLRLVIRLAAAASGRLPRPPRERGPGFPRDKPAFRKPGNQEREHTGGGGPDRPRRPRFEE
jgi:hypothetical protein